MRHITMTIKHDLGASDAACAAEIDRAKLAAMVAIGGDHHAVKVDRQVEKTVIKVRAKHPAPADELTA